jgi:hypothetical protein
VQPASLAAGLAAAVALRTDERRRLAAALSTRYAATDAILTDTGTSALVLALRSVIPKGGAVALPAYACIDLTSAALGSGVRVRLYDVDPITLSPDLDSLRKTVARGVDAIVVAHLFGYAADVAGARRIADEHGLPLIEDAAQGAGGSIFGQKLGSFGDVTILSFGRGKGLTGGSGGALLVRGKRSSDAIIEAGTNLPGGSSGLSDVTKLAAQWTLGRPALYRLPASIPALRLGEMVFRPPRPPRGISRAAATLVIGAIALDDYELRVRRAHAAQILWSLRSTNIAPIRAIAQSEPGYLRLALLDRRGRGRGSVRSGRSLGIARGYPMTLDQHAELQPLLVAGERAGLGSLELRDRLLTVPTHSYMHAPDVDHVVDALTTVPNSVRDPVAALQAS